MAKLTPAFYWSRLTAENSRMVEIERMNFRMVMCRSSLLCYIIIMVRLGLSSVTPDVIYNITM